MCYRPYFTKLSVLITSPGALKRVLVTNVRNYPKAVRTRRILSRLVGDSLLTVEGDEHSRQRMYLSPAFHFVHHARFQAVFSRCADALAKQWSAKAAATGGGAFLVDVHTTMTKMTLDIIGLTAFGYNFNALADCGEESEMIGAYNTVFANAGLSLTMILSFLVPGIENLPTPANRRIAVATAVIKGKVEEIIRAKRAGASSGASSGSGGDDPVDLLGLMLQETIAEGGVAVSAANISATELTDNVMTFLVAGHETTATTLCWALHLLSINPEAQVCSGLPSNVCSSSSC